MLVKESYADVIRGDRVVDELITVRPGDSLWAIIRKVRTPKFDVVLDLHDNIRSNIIGWFAGAKRIVRYRKAALARRLFVSWRFDSEQLKRHTLDRYFEALQHLDPKAGIQLSANPLVFLLFRRLSWAMRFSPRLYWERCVNSFQTQGFPFFVRPRSLESLKAIPLCLNLSCLISAAKNDP
jgi:ADP-heptose:LPS heptosyltransferase